MYLYDEMKRAIACKFDLDEDDLYHLEDKEDHTLFYDYKTEKIYSIWNDFNEIVELNKEFYPSYF